MDSFTELRTNRYGFTVPVRFESTGYKRIVNGQVWYRYVGIIEDTKFGVRE